MRVESSVTSVSWIPSEAMAGLMRLPMDIGLAHYDDPPPDVIHDFEALVQADGCRFANHLSAWIEADDHGNIGGTGYSGGGLVGATRPASAAPRCESRASGTRRSGKSPR